MISWLRNVNLDSADARVLLEHVTGLNRVAVATRPEQLLSDEHLERLNTMVEERRRGVPVPYLTGVQEFFSRPFRVSPAVLIPRPDTEVLIEWLLDNLAADSSLVDLGTGSGCIAVTLKKEMPGLTVHASDISEDALTVAKENARLLGAEIKFFSGSWLEAVPASLQLDAIISNPPYIRPDDEHLDALQFEPQGALTDFRNGLSSIDAILHQAAERKDEHLKLIAIEHGWDQGEAVRELFADHGFDGAATHKDYGGNDRFTAWKK